MAQVPTLRIGSWSKLDLSSGGEDLLVPARHLTTHGVVVGMTGSGKTGLVTVLVEEALSAGIPTVVIDIKGDLPSLLLTFPGEMPPFAGTLIADRPRDTSPEAAEFARTTQLRVITPGSSAGESLHVLSSLERRSTRWDTDPESARNALGAAVSLVLRLLGREADPAKSREHVLLSILAERRLLRGETADIGALMQELANPPVERVGALAVDLFMKKRERAALAAALNNLVASPSFSSWREGASLDVAEWLTPVDGRTPGTIVSVAHLDDEERQLVLGVVLEEILCHVRSLPGSSDLKALVVFDEVYGYLPPHPANPPTKRPIVSLMKQARAFGVGVVIATQNPMDLDYRALSNAGLWWIGRLQTDADRNRVIEGLASSTDFADTEELGRSVARLAPRWFLTRNAHVPEMAPILVRPRDTHSVMRGPLTPRELRELRKLKENLACPMDLREVGGLGASQ